MLSIECQSQITPIETTWLQNTAYDLAADAVSEAFGEWTTKDLVRPSKVYEIARTGDNIALRQLSTVLRMNADVEESLIFARVESREAKLAATFALGSMELGERYDDVIDTLLKGAAGDDEEITLRSLEAGYRAASQRRQPAPPALDGQLERTVKTGQPSAIHLAASLLSFHRKGLSDNAVDLCLDAVANVFPENKGTISYIDHAAYQLLDEGCTERVVGLLAQLIDRTDGKITFDELQSTFHALKNAGADVLGGAIVSWLLNGGTHTRRCLASAVCGVGHNAPDPPPALSLVLM